MCIPAKLLSSPLSVAIAALAFSACSGGSPTAPSVPGIGSATQPDAAATPLLFVGAPDFSQGSVFIYPQKGINQAPIGNITDAVFAPNGLFVDKSGTLYVANLNAETITEYLKGQVTHSKTLSTTPYNPQYVAVGLNGTVYVSIFPAGKVLEYANGSTTPTLTLSVPNGGYAQGVAVDKHNYVYVPHSTGSGSQVALHVLQFPPGSTQGKDLGIDVKGGVSCSVAIDSLGNLLLGDQIQHNVYVFPPGATQPSHVIHLKHGIYNLSPYQIALNHANTHLYVVNGGTAAAFEYTYPGGTLIDTVSKGMGYSSGHAAGVATLPDGSP
jgi:hypothetical protein